MSRSGTILLIVAVALAALALLLANPFRDSVRRDNPESEPLFAGDAVMDANRVEIRAPGEAPVILTRGAGGWTVASRDGFPADSAAVASILRGAADARTTGPVSTNPENFGRFQVDSTGVGVRMTGEDGDLAAFTVGKSGRDFTTSYIRPEGAEAVYVVRGLNRNLFTRPKGFRDPSILRFDPSSVVGVTLTDPEGGWTVTRTDSMWVRSRDGEEPSPASAQGVDDLLRGLGTLDADAFADGAPDTLDTGLENPGTTIVVRFDDGTEKEILIGNENGRNQRFVARPGRRVLYLLGQWRVDRLVRDYDSLAG